MRIFTRYGERKTVLRDAPRRDAWAVIKLGFTPIKTTKIKPNGEVGVLCGGVRFIEKYNPPQWQQLWSQLQQYPTGHVFDQQRQSLGMLSMSRQQSKKKA
jgi:hypothetical protein